MDFNFIKKSSFIIAILFLSGCAHTPVEEAHKNNEIRFETLLKDGRIKEAVPFALYFSKKLQNKKQILLMAQYSIYTCNPQESWKYIELLNDGNEKKILQATILALVTIPRPWTKAILSIEDFTIANSKNESSSTPTKMELVKDEIWQDEWKNIHVQNIVCKEFPILPESETRYTQQKKAMDLFNILNATGDWPSLQIMGLAMDVGIIPESEKINFYLKKFVSNYTHPYYVRLQFFAQNLHNNGIGADKKSVRAKRGNQNEFILTSLHLRTQEFQPKEIDLPWILDLWSDPK